MQSPTMLYYLQTNAVCTVILLYLFFHIKARLNSAAAEDRLFDALIFITVIYCISDCLAWYADGKNFTGAGIVVYFANIIYILYAPVMSYLWDDYLLCKTDGKRAHNSAFGKLHLVCTVIISLLTITTPFSGLAFSVDKMNNYHRGVIAYAAPAVAGFFILYMTVSYTFEAIRNKKMKSRDNFRMVIQFFVPILISFMLQLFLYGASVIQVGITVSLMIVFIFNQETQISCDELTGLNNRREFNKYVEKNYNSDRSGEACICLIDADNFKKINDTYGHLEGDRALRRITEAIKHACNENGATHWFIARIGGDEFVTVGFVQSEEEVMRLKDNLHNELDKANSQADAKYSLGLSVGYALGKLTCDEDKDRLVKLADEEMYRDKAMRKQISMR